MKINEFKKEHILGIIVIEKAVQFITTEGTYQLNNLVLQGFENGGNVQAKEVQVTYEMDTFKLTLIDMDNNSAIIVADINEEFVQLKGE